MPNERAQGTVVSFPGSANSIQFTSSEVYSLPSLSVRWERQHLWGWEAMGGERGTQSLLSSVPLEGLKVPAAFRGGRRGGGSLLPLHPPLASELSRHE